jgi:hypothetical protein
VKQNYTIIPNLTTYLVAKNCRTYLNRPFKPYEDKRKISRHLLSKRTHVVSSPLSDDRISDDEDCWKRKKTFET